MSLSNTICFTSPIIYLPGSSFTFTLITSDTFNDSEDIDDDIVLIYEFEKLILLLKWKRPNIVSHENNKQTLSKLRPWV